MKRRLLICTQTVDSTDPVLGFFHRWIEEFALHSEQVVVVCLREGTHKLPSNVQVVRLRSKNKPERALEFIRVSVLLRHKYDSVFVHMNPEYLIVAGLLWRVWGKKVALWYAHGTVNMRLRAAVKFCDAVFTSTSRGFRINTPKRRVLGQGIDTDFFSPDPSVVRGREVVSVGRLSLSKRHDLIIRAMQHSDRELWIAGDGPERGNLENLAHTLGLSSRVHFLGGCTQAQLRDLYRRAFVLAHAGETGSLDKVVLEALASGCPVVTTSKELHGVPACIVGADPESIALGIERSCIANPEYVRREHSLPRLVSAIMSEWSTMGQS